MGSQADHKSAALAGNGSLADREIAFWANILNVFVGPQVMPGGYTLLDGLQEVTRHAFGAGLSGLDRNGAVRWTIGRGNVASIDGGFFKILYLGDPRDDAVSCMTALDLVSGSIVDVNFVGNAIASINTRLAQGYPGAGTVPNAYFSDTPGNGPAVMAAHPEAAGMDVGISSRGDDGNMYDRLIVNNAASIANAVVEVNNSTLRAPNGVVVLGDDFKLYKLAVTGGAPSATLVPTINMLTPNQASLETNTVGWTSELSCTLARSVAFAEIGAGSLELTSTNVGTVQRAITPTGLAGIPVVPRKMYTAMFDSRAVTTIRYNAVYIVWYDAAGGLISATTVLSLYKNTTTGWTRYKVRGVAPTNAAFAAVRIETANLEGGPVGEKQLYDKIGLFPGDRDSWVASY